jgi:hypothetical protein
VRGIIPVHNQHPCMERLSFAGFLDDAIHLLEGPEGVRILDTSGVNHGIKSRFVRMTQALGSEGNELRTLDAALHKGHIVFSVAIADWDEALVAARAMVDSGGDRVLHYTRGSFQLLN